MIRKFIIKGGTAKGDLIEIALRYNMETGECIIGGNQLHIPAMKSFVDDFFSDEKVVPEYKFVGMNKIKYIWQCSQSKFDEGIERLQQLRIPFSSVKSLGRIMR